MGAFHPHRCNTTRRHRRRLAIGTARGIGVDIDPDRTIGTARAHAHTFGQRQHQFGRTGYRARLDLFHALGRIDPQAADVRGCRGPQPHDDLLAFLTHAGAAADDTGKLYAGKGIIGPDADFNRIGLTRDRHRSHGRKHKHPCCGGRNRGLQGAFSGDGPGHFDPLCPPTAFMAVNAD